MDQVEKEAAETKIMNEVKITEEKVNRIKQKDQSRRIPMGKPARQDNDTVSWNYNKGEEATQTTKIYITTKLQDPEFKHLQVTIKEWKNPSEKDKAESYELLKKDLGSEYNTMTDKKVGILPH